MYSSRGYDMLVSSLIIQYLGIENDNPSYARKQQLNPPEYVCI